MSEGLVPDPLDNSDTVEDEAEMSDDIVAAPYPYEGVIEDQDDGSDPDADLE